MARILFGGPQEKKRGQPDPKHNDLVARLKQEGHDVDYFTRGDEMMEGLLSCPAVKHSQYQLIIYDTGLFHDQAELQTRVNIFNESVIDYLRATKSPVIVLAEPEMAELISSSVKNAGFRQVNQPYNIEDIMDIINSAIR